MKHLLFLSKSLLVCSLACVNISCERYLDSKPDQKMATVSSLADLQAVLNNANELNTGYTGLAEKTTDNYYFTTPVWEALDDVERANYIFDNYDTNVGQWSNTYQAIFYSNLVLEGLEKINEPSNATYNRDHIAGQAHFFRAFAYYQLAQVFCKVFDPRDAETQAGLVIRRGTALEEDLRRATVAQTYEQMLSDVQMAIRLLPNSTLVPTRPNKPAAYALMARIHLVTGNYDHAGLYADSVLRNNNALIDYNTLDPTSNTPFARYNSEVLFDSRMNASDLSPSRAKVNPELFARYDEDDLRKQLFFRSNTDGSYRFKGGYDGQNSSETFNGITTTEMYLVKAECLARQGKLPEATLCLTKFLNKRWRGGEYTGYMPVDPADFLAFVVEERRKELAFRGIWWSDMRRLAREGLYERSIFRTLDHGVFELPATAMPDYTYVLPLDVMRIGGYARN